MLKEMVFFFFFFSIQASGKDVLACGKSLMSRPDIRLSASPAISDGHKKWHAQSRNSILYGYVYMVGRKVDVDGTGIASTTASIRAARTR